VLRGLGNPLLSRYHPADLVHGTRRVYPRWRSSILQADVLLRIKGLASLSEPDRQALADIGSLRHLDDRTVILLEGDQERSVFMVLEGAVRVYRANLEGREQTVIYLRPGEALNLPAAFASDRSAAASAQAVGNVTLLRLGLQELRQLVLQRPAIGLALLGMMADRVRHLSLMVYDLGLLSVRARLARFLLSEHNARRDSPVRWTHAEIAAQVGTVRVVISRTLSALADEGLIRLDRQRIEILDPAALAEAAELDLPS
jgi:CRP-like cAMP-binding protein